MPPPPPPVPPLRFVVVNPTGVTIGVGGSVQFTAASNIPVTAWIWAVSDSSRAAISPGGLVTGLAAGPVAVAACAVSPAGVCGSATLTITNVIAGVPTVTVTPAQATLLIGDTLQMSVTGSFTGAPWSWTMLDEAVGSVSATGLVMAKKSGVTVLRVCASSPWQNVCGSADITVR